MKKIFIMLMLLVPAACLFSLPVMIGVEGNYGTIFTGQSSSNTIINTVTYTTNNEMNVSQFNFKVFLDASFFRFDIGYLNVVYPMSGFVISNNIKTVGSGIVAQGFNWTYLTIGAMAKLPIELSRKANIWFGLGVEYMINLTYDLNMDGTNDNIYGAAKTKNRGDFNDLMGVAAMGFTFDVNESIAIIPSIKFKYDFTPFPYTDAYLLDAEGMNIPADQLQAYKDNMKITILTYEIGIGFAIKL